MTDKPTGQPSLADEVALLTARFAKTEPRLVIGGDLLDARSGHRLPTVDPSSGSVITDFPYGDEADVDRAVQAATIAQPPWRRLGFDGRKDLLDDLRQLLGQHAHELALLDCLDGGLPYGSAVKDVGIALAALQEWPALVRWHGGRTIPASAGNLHYTDHRPYGVVGRIVPFNHPAMFAIAGIVPALLAGNTVVLKPAPQTPLSALRFADLARSVLPPGVVNVISGGAEAGRALAAHPQVKRLAFTGSVRTGIDVQRCAATSAVKHVSLELGGKNAMVVFPDVNVDEVAQAAVNGMNFAASSGQSCGSNSRVFVHADVHDAFLERTADKLAGIRVGPAYDGDSQMGPLVSSEQRDKVLSYIRQGCAEGAQLLVGSELPLSDATSKGGFFVPPTLFANVKQSMRIAREEIFGPVLSVLRWEDMDAVLEDANDVDYGLTASVWTNDLNLAHQAATSLDAGYIWINNTARHYFGVPFGGTKNSGIGREECVEEYESYLELKSVNVVLRTMRPTGQ